MAVPARHRRRTPLRPSPLPLRTPLGASSMQRRTQNGTCNAGTAICISLLCLLIVVGALFSTTFHLPATVHKGRELLSGRRSVPRAAIANRRRIGGGGGERVHQKPIAYVDLSQSTHQYDVIVVGCGPAGLSAALFASRMGLSVLVFGSPSAGSLAGTDRLDNFPSFLGLGHGGGGQGWVDTAMEQASSFGAEFAPPTVLATGLTKTKMGQNDLLEVHLGDATQKKVHGKTVIVASGSTPRRLNLPHEQTLWGHSLHSCALCDGDLYARGKKSVAVIGGGDAAVEAVSLLHKMGVESIHWIHRREEYRASAFEVERVGQLPNVDVWAPFVVTKWMTKESGVLDGVRIVGAIDGVADPEAASSLTIPVDGAFLMIGSTPNSDWLQSSGMDIDPTTKLVRIASSQDDASDNESNNPLPQFSTATSIDGAFSAGEVTDEVYRQALTASSEGAKAAIDAQRYLRHMGMETSAQRVDVGKREPVVPKTIESDEESKGPVYCDLTKAECIQSVVLSHPVVVFSKYYCPHCRRALEALRAFTYKSADLPLVLDLTNIKGGLQAQDTLAVMTGRRTVPNVFVGGKSIGGGDETTALHREGKLEGLLRDAGAI